MLILSSSAKTLDLKSEWPVGFAPLVPAFQSEADQLVARLKKMELKDLEAVLHVSEKIAIVNAERFQTYVKWPEVWEDESALLRPMLYCYKGDVFRELQLEKYGEGELSYAARSVFVSSGLYGIVGAQDGIQPYRLEMKAKLPGLKLDGGSSDKNGVAIKMNQWWRENVTHYLNERIAENAEGGAKDFGTPHHYFLNLASIEYSAAVDRMALEIPVIDVEFKEVQEDGTMKTVGIFAKRARGMMIDHCVTHHIESLDGLRLFTRAGYELVADRAYEDKEKKGIRGSRVLTFAR
jgi:cytoplasmic iron level regulating protein YaaA (DUF328/UPF0246 family)